MEVLPAIYEYYCSHPSLQELEVHRFLSAPWKHASVRQLVDESYAIAKEANSESQKKWGVWFVR